MDVITHAMSGALIGASASRKREFLAGAMTACVFASAILDVADVWLWPVDLELYRRYHRVFTHSIFSAPFLAALSAFAGWLIIRSRYLYLFSLSFLCVAVHLGMDLFCDWPLRLLYPLSEADFALYLVNYTSYPALISLTLAASAVLLLRNSRWEKPENREQRGKKNFED